MSNGQATNLIQNRTADRVDAGSELAAVGEGIVKRLTAILEHKIGMTNISGHIVADSDLSNFDKFVPAALSAVQKGSHAQIPSGEIDELAGWAVPLRHQDRLVGTLLIRNEPAPSDDVVPLAKSLAELLLYQMLIMDKLSQESRTLDRFFYDLFENDRPQEKLLRESVFFNSQFFQIDFNEPRICAVLVVKNFQHETLQDQPVLPADEHKLTAAKDKIRESAEKTLKINPPPIVAYLGLDEFVILLPHKPVEQKNEPQKGGETLEYLFTKEQLNSLLEDLNTKFQQPTFIGLGDYHPEITGLIKSYKGAKSAAHLGIKLLPKQKIYYYGDLLLPIMLSETDRELQNYFVENELGALIKHQDLVETLASHFESNLNLKKTAFELGIHKNTLYYRLAKIKKILGIDPQEFKHALRLKVALYLWQMNKEDET